MSLNVYRVFHVNCLPFFIVTLRGQRFGNVFISQFIEEQFEALYGLGNVLNAQKSNLYSACYHSSCRYEICSQNQENTY